MPLLLTATTALALWGYRGWHRERILRRWAERDLFDAELELERLQAELAERERTSADAAKRAEIVLACHKEAIALVVSEARAGREIMEPAYYGTRFLHFPCFMAAW